MSASGTDRHLDIGLQVIEAHPLFPYFLEMCLAIPTSPFFLDKFMFFCYLFNNNIVFQDLFYFNSDAISPRFINKYMSMGCSFPEIRAFGNLMMSTNVRRLIICKTL